jgi:hypothetical protein
VWWLVRSRSVTRTGALSSACAAVRPPKPAADDHDVRAGVLRMHHGAERRVAVVRGASGPEPGRILAAAIMNQSSDPQAVPVRVIEAIPVAGSSSLPKEQVAAEKIPSPPHLVLQRELARGAMGHVHPATDRNLLRQVALKRLDKDYATKTFYRDGFIAEAQITGQLEHPNIVPTHELAIDPNGIPYFTMKLVQGDSFDRWLAKRPPGTSIASRAASRSSSRSATPWRTRTTAASFIAISSRPTSWSATSGRST